MANIDRFSVLEVFLVYNDGDLKDVQVEQHSIYKYFEQIAEKSDILSLLDLNTADKLIKREPPSDPTEDWTYFLTEKGIQKIADMTGLDLIEDTSEITRFNSLIYSFLASNLPKVEKNAYEKTMNEIATCFKHNCLNAAISLCGKLIEIYLTELLTKHQIEIKWYSKGPNDIQGDFTTDLTLKQLLILAKSKLADDVKEAYLDVEEIERINKYRNGTIHYKTGSKEPKEDIALGVIHFASHILRLRLSWQ